MIHILKWVLKMLSMCIASLTIGLGSIILSVLFWDGYYMDMACDIYDHLRDI